MNQAAVALVLCFVAPKIFRFRNWLLVIGSRTGYWSLVVRL